MVKTLKNLLFQNQESYDLETWHAASRTQALQSYMNDDHRLTLTYLRKGHIGSPIRLNGKTVANSFNGEKLAGKDYID